MKKTSKKKVTVEKPVNVRMLIARMDKLNTRMAQYEEVFTRGMGTIFNSFHCIEQAQKIVGNKTALNGIIRKYLEKYGWLKMYGGDQVFRYTDILAKRTDMLLITEAEASKLTKGKKVKHARRS